MTSAIYHAGGKPRALDAAAGPGPEGRGPGRYRVLVVDDNALNAELLAVTLERLGYDVATAEGGRSALDAVSAGLPDVVLMDVLMPDLSGLEVLRQLRAAPGTADLPVILVSGLGETEDIVEGLRLGANDYVTKPINLPILQARVATQAALKRARDELKRSAALLRAELDRHARELRVAGQVQRSILPQSPPDSGRLAISWCYEPATEVGGDLFDVAPLPDGRTFLFLADAMGHGVQAALVVSIVKATLAAHLGDASDLPGLMARLDETLAGLFDDRFVTAAACVIDPAAGRLRYTLAGHPPPLVAGPGGVATLDADGMPLGTALGRAYQEGEAAFGPGGMLLLYSDGLTESLGPEGTQFGLRRVTDRYSGLIGSTPEESIRALRAALDGFRRGVPLIDDLTILTAKLA